MTRYGLGFTFRCTGGVTLPWCSSSVFPIVNVDVRIIVHISEEMPILISSMSM